MKKAIRYLRYSSDNQSQHSIERQDSITASWASQNNILVTDTFIDEGYSAKTFDRPDWKDLVAFIKKNQSVINYLVVAELSRFSREAGDAINMVKKIQKDHDICIVSASRSCVYDVYDSNSFFMMGLEFLLGNSENIKRQNDINGGIYTAKAIKGRYIGAKSPYGYTKNEQRMIVPAPDQAKIIAYIFEAFNHNTPQYIIVKRAIEMGLPRGYANNLKKILTNPVYGGMIAAKSWKDKPGGIFAGQHEGIVSAEEWHQAQAKMTEPVTRVMVTDELPLRGVLKCHCGRSLTGAPSRGRSGQYFFYYKCVHSKHNNISAIKAHNDLNQILRNLSLSDDLVKAIIDKSVEKLDEQLKENKSQLAGKKLELFRIEEKIKSLEEKWIENTINHETYNRWHMDFSQKRLQVKNQIEAFSSKEKEAFLLLQDNIVELTDLRHLYEQATTVKKQQLLKMVFDNRLYYQDRSYRTPYIMPILAHNMMKVSKLGLLHFDGIMPQYAEVELGGFEPPSKHIRRKLSTCLFHYWLSALHRK